MAADGRIEVYRVQMSTIGFNPKLYILSFVFVRSNPFFPPFPYECEWESSFRFCCDFCFRLPQYIALYSKRSGTSQLDQMTLLLP